MRRLIPAMLLIIIFLTGCPDSSKNRPPVLKINNQSIDEGKSLIRNLREYTIDEYPDLLTFEKSAGVGEISGDTYVFTPGTGSGGSSYQVAIEVTDNIGQTDTCTFTVVVLSVNSDPNQPSNPSPANLSVLEVTDSILSWSCNDPDGDTLTYDIYFGTGDMPEKVEDEHVTTSYDPGILANGTTYRWFILARDGRGGSAASPIWSFTTVPGINQDPVAPSEPLPENSATCLSIQTDLSWTCSDPDDDPLKYDIYFGTTIFPEKVATDVLPTSYDPGTLAYSTTYYWKIAAKDSGLGTTFSDLWSFSTEAEPLSEQVDLSGPVYDGNYLLVSNSSIDGEASQSPGTLGSISVVDTFSSGLVQEPYRKDFVIPLSEGIERSDLVSKYSAQSYSPGDTKSFWVKDFTTDEYYQITATLQYDGTRCQLWAENPEEITVFKASLMGNEFDSSMWQLVTENFSMPSDVDDNGKVAILCFDIRDGFQNSGGYIAGYFGANDLFVDPESNEMEIFYIDTYPGMYVSLANQYDITKAFSTVVHEFQHMVSFNRNYLVENNWWLDTWLDEGLSMAAEHMYEGVQLSRITYFNSSSSIKNGHALLYWDQEGDVLSNYSLSYLFIQYLREQVGLGNSVFKEIIEDDHSDYQAVEDVVHKYITHDLDFGRFMTYFRIATLLKNDTGYYGFKGNTDFDLLTPQTVGTPGNLHGGGAFFMGVDGSFTEPGDEGPDIEYAGISY